MPNSGRRGGFAREKGPWFGTLFASNALQTESHVISSFPLRFACRWCRSPENPNGTILGELIAFRGGLTEDVRTGCFALRWG